MSKELVLNELSVREAQSLHVARAWMAQLIDTILAAIQAGASRSLRTHAPLNSMLLAPDYSVSHWRNDVTVEREKRSYLRSLLSKSPYLTDEDSAEVLDFSLRSDFLFQGRAAVGLGSALLLQGLAISLPSEPCWDCSRILLTCLSLDEGGELSEGLAELPHASRAEHVADHSEWLAVRDTLIRSGHDLWQRRGELFPALDFCDAVGGQLVAISSGHPILRQIYKRLSELDHYFQTCDGTFDPSLIPMKISPESQSTLQRYKAEHSFACPDGIIRVFSWHGRLTPGAWRIYFIPALGVRRAVIGYIGEKLPSVLYPT